MAYKTTKDWKGYKAGEIVPQAEAESFLSRYRVISHQDILVEVAEEAPKVEIKEVKEKPATKKKTIKKKAAKK